AGSPSLHSGSETPELLAEAPGVFRAGLSRGCWLHGPGQLGHRSGWRLSIRLHAAERHSPLEPHGDPAAVALREIGHRDGTGPGTGLPRSLFKAGRDFALAAVRTSHLR